jgi:hypothetical protein
MKRKLRTSDERPQAASGKPQALTPSIFLTAKDADKRKGSRRENSKVKSKKSKPDTLFKKKD